MSAVVGLAAALRFARGLARPLDALSAEASRIRRFDFEGPVEARSSIVELANLIEAVSAMKAGLRNFGRFVPKDVAKGLSPPGARRGSAGSAAPALATRFRL